MKQFHKAIFLITCLLLFLSACAKAGEEGVTVKCPETLSYFYQPTGHVYSTFAIENIRHTFVTDEETGKHKMKITYDITKLSDDREEGSTYQVCWFDYVLYDGSGKVVAEKNLPVYKLLVGEKRKDCTFSIPLDQIKDRYTLEFKSRSIGQEKDTK